MDSRDKWYFISPQVENVSMYGTDTLEAHLGVALGHLWRWHI